MLFDLATEQLCRDSTRATILACFLEGTIHGSLCVLKVFSRLFTVCRPVRATIPAVLLGEIGKQHVHAGAGCKKGAGGTQAATMHAQRRHLNGRISLWLSRVFHTMTCSDPALGARMEMLAEQRRRRKRPGREAMAIDAAKELQLHGGQKG